MYAAGLLYDEEAIGIAIGEVIRDKLILHVEKALVEYDGVYPFLYQSFVINIADKVGILEYINREDDSGDIGLRTSKRQYQPLKQVHKYIIHCFSPAFENILK